MQSGDTWSRTDIDRYILASLTHAGIKPVGDADKATLLRRVYFDLTGLPPTLDEMRNFLTDLSPTAYERVVDRLLASPQFGERWGRHWLDVARYAESSGKDVNIAYPQAWRYRDYVIQSFNNDTPYNQFIEQQLAGDLLPAKNDSERARNLIATGFLAIGTKSINELSPKQFAVDMADEQVSTISMALLGTTMGCARCHDHKFDPISQRDYTGVLGIFLSTDTRYGTSGVNGRNLASLISLPTDIGLPTVVPLISRESFDQKKAKLKELSDELQAALAERRSARMASGGAPPKKGAAKNGGNSIVRLSTQVGELEAELANYDDYGHPVPLAMGVSEKPVTFAQRTGTRGPLQIRGQRGNVFEVVSNAPLFARGDVTKPTDLVQRGVPALLTFDEGVPVPAKSSGRLELAQWIASPTNALTSRVFVNRAWHYLFGPGLVRSVDNFGTTGDKPTNPELLDHLAVTFTKNGWSVKSLVRQIVLSHAYQLSTQDNSSDFAVDPDNHLLWRQNPRRLDAECIRDAMLVASGTLNRKPQPGSLIAQHGDGPIGAGRFASITDAQLLHQDASCRAVYLGVARNSDPELLSIFDYPDASAPLGVRETTNVPSQALYLMNSDFVAQQSAKLADRIIKSFPGRAADRFDDRFRTAYQLIFSREPVLAERTAARNVIGQYPSDASAAWTSICRAMFTSSAFRYLN